MGAGSLYDTFSNLIIYKRDSLSYDQDPYITGGGLAYGILCTFSLFLMITLSIIYGRLEYNRIFAYFCISMVALYIPHVLGAWIFGANLRRAPSTFCWIQALWINASGIASGISVLIYSYELYRRIVWHLTDGEWKRRKYYIAICIVFPLLVGVIPPFLIAERPDGIAPGPFFCMLYEPSIPMALVSVEGWNTLTSLFGIYFSMRTVIEVIALSYTYEESDKTPQHQLNAEVQDFDYDLSSPTSIATTEPNFSNNQDSISTRTTSSIPIYVLLRLILFALLYCAVTILSYGRDLYLSIRQIEYDRINPTYLEYVISLLGIVIFIVFGTSLEACKAYWHLLKVILSFRWLKRWSTRKDSFGDWERDNE